MKNSTYLMIHRIIKAIADSIIKVFIPILIFKQTGNITLCFVYFLLNFALTSLFFFLGRKIIQKIPMISIIIGIFLLMGGNMLLLLKIDIWIIVAISLLEGLYSAMYFGAVNMIFGLLDKNANAAKFEGGEYIGKAIFTILSAYILGQYQNSLLFIVLASVGLYALCTIPLFIKLKEIQGNVKSLPVQSQKVVFSDNKMFNIYHFVWGIVSFSVNYFLPFFLFVRGLSFTDTGFLLALQNVGGFAIGFLTNFTDKKKITKYFVTVAAILLIPAFFVIMFVSQTVVCYIFTIVLTLTSHFISIAIYRRFVLDQTGKNYYHDSVFYRDVFINAGRTLSPTLFLITPFYPVVFGIGIAASVALMFSANHQLKQTQMVYDKPEPAGDASPDENKQD